MQIDRRLNRLRQPFWPAGKRSGTELALRKLDKLTRFFESSTFFENDDAKEMLLDQLETTHQRWERMPWEALRKTVPVENEDVPG